MNELNMVHYVLIGLFVFVALIVLVCSWLIKTGKRFEKEVNEEVVKLIQTNELIENQMELDLMMRSKINDQTYTEDQTITSCIEK